MQTAALFDAMLEALGAERAALRLALGALEGRTRVPARRGARVIAEPGAHVYAFACDLDVLLAEGTRVQVQAPGLTGSAEVVDHDPALGQIRLLLREDLGTSVPDAWLDFDPSRLTGLLAGRLADLREGAPVDTDDDPVLRRALALLEGTADPGAPTDVSGPGCSPRQTAALGFVLGQEVAYLWGPPGTGKTQTVAALVHALIARGERVLLAAHTNIATDNALARVLRGSTLAPGVALRVGYVGEGLDAARVGLDEQVDRVLRAEHEGDAVGIERLCQRLARLTPGPPDALVSARAALPRRLRAATDLLPLLDPDSDADLLAEANDLGARVRRTEQRLVDRARVVATTLTRVATSRLFRHTTFDTLLLDEASTASLLHAFVAATRATRRVVAVGDFQQLPAIVQSEHPAARRWLGRHVFASAGCDRPERDHPLRAMLDEQWRMHPQLAQVVSRVFYAGRLHDAPEVAARAAPEQALLLLDTSALDAVTERPGARSKVNRVHADLIAGLAARLPTRRLALIAPYRAQVRALRGALRRVAPARLARGEIEVFTVHRFQGRDADVAIVDLTEAPGTPCRFLSEVDNPDAPNLINVALSRARSGLIVIAHLGHLVHALGRGAVVNRVFAAMREAGALEVVAGDPRDEGFVTHFLDGLAEEPPRGDLGH